MNRDYVWNSSLERTLKQGGLIIDELGDALQDIEKKLDCLPSDESYCDALKAIYSKLKLEYQSIRKEIQ